VKTCDTCGRNPERMNSSVAQCSHVDCPNRKLYDDSYYTPEREAMERGLALGTYAKRRTTPDEE
jgi:hypothetical protein